MSRIFIDRPIFAWVIAIIIMLAGVGAIMALPIAQYPDVAPPQVNVRATYPGASAETVAPFRMQMNAVTAQRYVPCSRRASGTAAGDRP